MSIWVRCALCGAREQLTKTPGDRDFYLRGDACSECLRKDAEEREAAREPETSDAGRDGTLGGSKGKPENVVSPCVQIVNGMTDDDEFTSRHRITILGRFIGWCDEIRRVDSVSRYVGFTPAACVPIPVSNVTFDFVSGFVEAFDTAYEEGDETGSIGSWDMVDVLSGVPR